MSLSWLAGLVLAAATILGQSVTANNLCAKPAVRREWRSMSPRQQAEWINAVKCLNSLPHDPSLVPTYNTTYAAIPPVNTSGSYFDDWSYVHMDLNRAIHFTGHFLPWHRAYVKDFETALQEKCGYKGTQPYWDWTLDSANFQNSTWWNPDPISGIGGWGDPNNDYQITTGAFVNFTVSYPSPHRLRRQYTPTVGDGRPLAPLFSPESQREMVNSYVGNFIGFQTRFEASSHGAVHRIVGGDLVGDCPAGAVDCIPGPKWSPNDPLFMMHHSMVDKLWYDWQNTNPVNFWSFGGGATSLVRGFIQDETFPTGAPPFLNFSTPVPTDGIMNEWTIYELMHTRNERLCYIYK